MLKDTNALRQEAADTADQLAHRVGQLEDEIKGLVVDTKETIASKIDMVKQMSPVAQTKAHPFPAVGLAAAAGFLMTYSKGSGRAVRQIGRFGKTFDKEFGVARSLATGFLLEKLSQKLSQSYPEIAEVVKQFKGKTVDTIH